MNRRGGDPGRRELRPERGVEIDGDSPRMVRRDMLTGRTAAGIESGDHIVADLIATPPDRRPESDDQPGRRNAFRRESQDRPGPDAGSDPAPTRVHRSDDEGVAVGHEDGDTIRRSYRWGE